MLETGETEQAKQVTIAIRYFIHLKTSPLLRIFYSTKNMKKPIFFLIYLSIRPIYAFFSVSTQTAKF